MMNVPTPPPVPLAPPKQIPIAISIDRSVELPEFPEPSRETMRELRRDQWSEIRQFLVVLLLLGCVVGWLITWIDTPQEVPGKWPLHLLFLAIPSAWVGARVTRRIFGPGSGWAWLLGFAAVVLAIVVSTRFETFRESEDWKTPTGNKAWTTYTYSRWNGDVPIYEHTTIDDEKGDLGWSRKGALVGERERQGEWEFHDWKAPWGQKTSHVWYWYGNEVSEGRWHELSRD